MLQACSIFAQINGELWDKTEMINIMLDIAKKSLNILGKDLFNQLTKK